MNDLLQGIMVQTLLSSFYYIDYGTWKELSNSQEWLLQRFVQHFATSLKFPIWDFLALATTLYKYHFVKLPQDQNIWILCKVFATLQGIDNLTW